MEMERQVEVEMEVEVDADQVEGRCGDAGCTEGVSDQGHRNLPSGMPGYPRPACSTALPTHDSQTDSRGLIRYWREMSVLRMAIIMVRIKSKKTGKFELGVHYDYQLGLSS